MKPGKLELIWIITMLFPLYIRGQVPGQAAVSEIGIDEKLEDTIPADIQLVRYDGATVSLGSVIDKPTVLSLVYYRCPGICSPLMDGIAEVIDKSDMKIGEDYQVLTVSFDPRETTELAVRKRFNYLNLVKKEGADSSWIFFTADSANGARLTESVGFRYKRMGNDFTHAATLIVVSPERKITRYLNGTYFLPFEFKMALVEASKGQAGPTVNKILQYCYSYDPQGKQYVLSITRVSGILISLVALLFLGVLIIRPLFRKRTVSQLNK
jgi:protein SCO1/2